MARRGEEVGERVGFLGELAFLVPAPALFRAAAHMGDGVDEAAIDQRQPVGREARVHGMAIGAVAVDQHRRGPVERRFPPISTETGTLSPSAAAASKTPHDIGRRVEIFRRHLLLDEAALARGHVVIVGLLAAGHRGIAEAHDRRVELVDRLEPQVIGLAPRTRSRAPRRWRDRDTMSRGRFLAREQHEIVLEQRRASISRPSLAGTKARQFASSRRVGRRDDDLKSRAPPRWSR